jgi:lysophospholipase L1-like esterase
MIFVIAMPCKRSQNAKRLSSIRPDAEEIPPTHPTKFLMTSLRSCLVRIVLAALSIGALPVQAEDRRELKLYDGKPLSSWHVTVAGFEGPEQVLKGDAVTIPKPANSQIPNGVVGARMSGKAGERDALTLHWKDAWYAGLRLEGGQPLDLLPYIAGGTLEFDVNVAELAHGGITFRMECGPDCARTVQYAQPGRALAGKGWQHLAIPMTCFVRDGDDFSKVTLPFALDGTGAGEVSVAGIKLVRQGKPSVSCPDYRTESVTPAPLTLAWVLDWWMPRHEAKLKEIRKLKEAGKDPQIVFIGDSITEGWERSGLPVWKQYYEKYNAVDLGFGSDRTENVLWRLQHGEVDGIAPKVAVLLIGTNNTGSRQEDPKTTAAGIKRIIDELRQRLPQTKVLLLAIFPRGEQPADNLRRINERVNAIISGFDDGRHVFFLDINAALMNQDGTLFKDIMPDLLHPNEKGYEIWAQSMAPALRKLLSD